MRMLQCSDDHARLLRLRGLAVLGQLRPQLRRTSQQPLALLRVERIPRGGLVAPVCVADMDMVSMVSMMRTALR